MDYEVAYEKVESVVRRVLRSPDLVLTPATKPAHVNYWDSLAHTWIVVEVEKVCDVRLDVERATAVECFGDLVDLVVAASEGSAS